MQFLHQKQGRLGAAVAPEVLVVPASPPALARGGVGPGADVIVTPGPAAPATTSTPPAPTTTTTTTPPIPLSFTDRLTGTRVSLALVIDGKL